MTPEDWFSMPLDRRTGFPEIGQQEGNTAAALGQLQGRVDGATDALHVVFKTEQEAGDQLAAAFLAGIEEGRGGWLETTGQDLFHESHGEVLVAIGEGQGNHDHAVLITLKVAFAVAGLQRIGGIIFECAEEGRETELLGIGLVPDTVQELLVIETKNRSVVIILIDEIAQLLVQAVKEHGVLVHMLEKILSGGFTVRIEADFAVLIIEIQHGIQAMVIQRFR